MDKVITVGFGENLIDRLAGIILDHAGETGTDKTCLQRFCVVFGGRRPQLFLKKSLAARIGRPFLPPKFFSMDEFVDFTCSGSPASGKTDELSNCFLLYRLAKQRLPELLRNRESFPRFLAWAREILNFIEQLDLEDVPDGPLKDIELSAAIGYEVPESINDLLRHISLLRQEFHCALRQRSLMSRGMAYREAAAAAAGNGYPDFDLIIFCNFYFLHASERRILRELHRNGKAMLVFQRDGSEWPVLERTEKELGISIKPEAEKGNNPEIRFYAAFDTHSQAACCRQILRELPRDESTVVVLPDPDALVPLLSEICADAPELNVSLGYPLKRSPLYSLFSLIFQAQNTRKNGAYYSRDYLKALSHPLAKNLCRNEGISRVLVHKVEEMLTGIIETGLSGTLFIDPDRIGDSGELFGHAGQTLAGMGIAADRNELSAMLAELHRLLFRNWEKADTFAAFCDACGRLLDAVVDTSPAESYPLNLMACNAALDMVSLLRAGDFDEERFERNEIFRVFLSDLENRSLSFSGSPLKGLQVLGLFETRSLNFDNVILLDVNEQILPRLNVYEPLIPREVMLGLGLNRIEKEDEIQRYQFFRLIRGSRKTHLIFSAGAEREKSRFLEEIVWERQKASGRLEADISRLAFSVNIRPGKKEARKTPEMVEALKKRVYSASSLNTYLMCPMRFYFQYVLGLDEKTDLLDETEARDVGTFCHDLLEESFQPFVGKKPVIDARFRERFGALFKERFHERFERTLRPDSFLLKEVLAVRLNAFLDKEAGREVNRIVCLEQGRKGTIRIDGQDYSFTYRVDRVDRMEDGSLMVIDYKSGGADLKPASMRAILSGGMERRRLKRTLKSIQMPMYMYFAGRDFPGERVNACLYSLRDSSITALLKPDGLDEIAAVEEVFLCSLRSLFKELFDPSIGFTFDEESPQYCSICPFTCACR